MISDLKNLLSPDSIEREIECWIKEDIPSFDFGAYVVGEKLETAHIFTKSSIVLAEWKIEEGTEIIYENKPILTAIVKGKVNKLLQAERIILNMLHRCCSIATLSRKYSNLSKTKEWKGMIAGTRKTTPGFRLIEKYGLLVGGVAQHRYDVSSLCMLKDNHIDSCGSITKAVQKAKEVCGFTIMIEVECRSLKDALEASKVGAHIVMLDNFKPEDAKKSAKEIKSQFPHVTIEISGGINFETISNYFSPDINVISVGSLTQGVPNCDISMKIQK